MNYKTFIGLILTVFNLLSFLIEEEKINNES